MDAESFAQKFAKTFNSGNVSALGQLYAPGAVLRHPMMGVLEGRAAIEAGEGPMFAAFSEIDWKLKQAIGQGSLVAIEFTIRARNTASLATPGGMVPATNKVVSLEASAFFRLDAQGTILEEQRYLDTAQFFRQLGLAG